jgi:hypothetical protein
MSSYDAKVHQDFADLLRIRAKRITFVFTLMAAIVGAGVGVGLGRMTGSPATMYIVIWTAVLGVFGFVAGKERSFTLQLKAIELLCQMQIESNTRARDAAVSAVAK